jgi:ribosomal protein L7Ae-like RNA K-turn-binding protein
MRPGQEEEARKHAADKNEFQKILREHKVDLIVISADCLEAKRLKKALSEFANLKICQD